MKKLITLVLALVLALYLIGCAQQGQQDYSTNPTQNNKDASQTESEQNTELEIVEPYASEAEFSYAEERKLYSDISPSIKTSGFVNTSKVDLSFGNVEEHAKNECIIEYDSIRTYLDTAECMWKVVFYTEGSSFETQTVYLDYDGITVLIVFGFD